MTNFIFPIKDTDFITKLIPQKFPFVMVDALVWFDSQSIKAQLSVDNSNIFVENNHFTESGLIEHMAQTVALHTGYQYFLRNKVAPIGYIGSIKSIFIEKRPKVGDTIVTKANILQEFMGVTLVSIESKLNKDIIATAQMKTVITS